MTVTEVVVRFFYFFVLLDFAAEDQIYEIFIRSHVTDVSPMMIMR